VTWRERPRAECPRLSGRDDRTTLPGANSCRTLTPSFSATFPDYAAKCLFFIDIPASFGGFPQRPFVFMDIPGSLAQFREVEKSRVKPGIGSREQETGSPIPCSLWHGAPPARPRALAKFHVRVVAYPFGFVKRRGTVPELNVGPPGAQGGDPLARPAPAEENAGGGPPSPPRGRGRGCAPGEGQEPAHR
jgi:hypothetical protein